MTKKIDTRKYPEELTVRLPEGTTERLDAIAEAEQNNVTVRVSCGCSSPKVLAAYKTGRAAAKSIEAAVRRSLYCFAVLLVAQLVSGRDSSAARSVPQSA